MATLVRRHDVDADGLARLRRARDGIVLEQPSGRDTFTLADGPMRSYERRLEVTQQGDARYLVVERTRFRLAVPVWSFVLVLPVRWALRTPRFDGRQPWWAPPVRLGPREAAVLGVLATLDYVASYLGTLLSQTTTFAADSFGADTAAQGTLFAVARAGVLATLVATGAADRLGRRRVMRGTLVTACVVMATVTLAPGLVWFGAAQTASRAMTTAADAIILIHAAEEMPARARAWAVSVLTLTAGLGSGLVVWLLPLADLGSEAWRLLYLPPALFIVVVLWAIRRLPETRRFTAAVAAAGGAMSGIPWRSVDRRTLGRLGLLAGSAVLLLAFASPASQFHNEFLRTERGMSASLIAVFTLVTSTPAGVGVYLGGRLSDTAGRRRVATVAIVGGTLFSVLGYLTFGTMLWSMTIAATIVGGMTIPTMRAYQPELFPTALRGKANGVLTVAGVSGSVIGVLVVGQLAGPLGSISWPIVLLAAAPLVVAVLVITLYPETSGLELEQINPLDDRRRPPAGELAEAPRPRPDATPAPDPTAGGGS